MINFPNAKINLGLHVLRKRNDGFHDIETAFYPVPLHDSLEILQISGRKGSFRQYGLRIGGGKNLCQKAYDLLKEKYDIAPVDMYLLKNIPAGAGLGGGSSDAAHTLIMLNEMFNLDISSAELEILAAQLGSDCPFFIRNLPVLAQGRGEKFTPIKPGPGGKFIIVVKPEIHISTPEAYAMVKPDLGRASLRDILEKPVEQWKDVLLNDFETPVFKKYPAIGQIKQKMYEDGALYASMSGSGSAVFGIFPHAVAPSYEHVVLRAYI
ncbi:MAG: 4-(cytidine 5'-diphospho)-2-C-methyl-D-erythritol kinase [Bacteroidales bacterium]|nr:4-(cytidine 5'-diphospho)-2-C-methyl-D-erythritol kinase [Bacteroidales bacterium]